MAGSIEEGLDAPRSGGRLEVHDSLLRKILGERGRVGANTVCRIVRMGT